MSRMWSGIKAVARWGIALLFWALPFGRIGAQDTLSEVAIPAPSSWEVRGYMKNLQTWLFFNEANGDRFLQDNLLHQRTNLRWTPTERLSLRAELRTRAFFGDLVRAQPDYDRLIDDANNDVLDLSAVLHDGNAWVVHSMVDRLYAEYSRDKWEVRLGRQRINWGIGTVWNPNDVFNAFSFTDFDYEERPGSDALRVRYFSGAASSVELAVKAFKHREDAVAALLWKFNALQFDWQLLGGYVREDLVLGAGWAGNLGNAGLKGELSYFAPVRKGGQEAFAFTVAGDYSFNNSLYVQAGYLYNSLGALRGDIQGLFGFRLSAKNLYPFRHALFMQANQPITPLLYGGLSLIYSPVESRAFFLNPLLTLSMAPNWDLDLVGQIVANRSADQRFSSPVQAVFLRTKFSF